MGSIFWIVSEWARCDKGFAGVPLHALALLWVACVSGGRTAIHVILSSCLCLLMVFLK